MPWETWAVHSVRDHLASYPLVVDCLLNLPAGNHLMPEPGPRSSLPVMLFYRPFINA